MTKLTAGLVLVLLFGLILGCGGGDAARQMYHCPMHPTYVADRPGDCPICGMRLVPVPDTPASGTAEDHGAAPDATPSTVHPLDSHASITLTDESIRLAGVRTVTAVEDGVARPVRTVGRVLADETRLRQVTTKVGGWVEKLHVDATGALIRAGEPILSLYSPELLASQEEYLRAKELVAQLMGSELNSARRGADELVASARRRLELLDAPSELIARLDQNGGPERTVVLRAPVSGYVIAKAVLQGMQVEPGTELYTVADLSQVWVEASFYESEAASLRPGESARLTFPSEPGLSREARIDYVYPSVDPETRTVAARFIVPNPDLRLKPGMFANVELDLAAGNGVVVPEDAVIETGERQLVFVSLGGGRFEPREVKIGLRGGGRAIVLDGISAGDEVVVHANFLLDSESRIRAAIGGMNANERPASGHAH